MLLVEVDEAQGIATLTPDGSLTEEDFESAAKIIDPYIEDTGKLNGIIIYTQTFPGWDSFAALCSHLEFVKDYHKHISCVAAVTDSKLGDFAEPIANHFVNSTIKLFPYSKLNEAKEWIINFSDDTKESVMKIIPNGENRIDIEISGKLTSDDMKIGLDELISKSSKIQHGKMFYTIVDLNIPSLGAIGVEFSRLPELMVWA